MATFLYNPPSDRTKTKVAGVLLGLVSFYFIIYLVRMYIYWEDNAVVCDTDNILYAWLTNKMPEWAKKCMNYQAK